MALSGGISLKNRFKLWTDMNENGANSIQIYDVTIECQGHILITCLVNLRDFTLSV